MYFNIAKKLTLRNLICDFELMYCTSKHERCIAVWTKFPIITLTIHFSSLTPAGIRECQHGTLSVYSRDMLLSLTCVKAELEKQAGRGEKVNRLEGLASHGRDLRPSSSICLLTVRIPSWFPPLTASRVNKMFLAQTEKQQPDSSGEGL